MKAKFNEARKGAQMPEYTEEDYDELEKPTIEETDNVIKEDTGEKWNDNDSVDDDLSLIPQHNTNAEIGCWIQWKPTGDVGKVIGYKQVGSIQKIVLRLKGGAQIEVYDNPKAYEIIMRA